jgi:hypothetical protein
MQESWEELRDGQAFQSQQWRERERGKRADQERRRGGVFIPPPIKMAITAFQAG